jgi:hypothetical protein
MSCKNDPEHGTVECPEEGVLLSNWYKPVRGLRAGNQPAAYRFSVCVLSLVYVLLARRVSEIKSVDRTSCSILLGFE